MSYLCHHSYLFFFSSSFRIIIFRQQACHQHSQGWRTPSTNDKTRCWIFLNEKEWISTNTKLVFMFINFKRSRRGTAMPGLASPTISVRSLAQVASSTTTTTTTTTTSSSSSSSWSSWPSWSAWPPWSSSSPWSPSSASASSSSSSSSGCWDDHYRNPNINTEII